MNSNARKTQQKNQNQGGLIEKLIKSGALHITTGARACLNTNLLDYKQKDALANEISAADKNFVVPEHGNWFTLNGEQTEFGSKPQNFADTILGVSNLYKDFDSEQTFATYGVVNFEIDFTKFDVEEEMMKRGFGVVFIGDSKNPTDSAVAHIANAKYVKTNPNFRVGYIRTLHETADSVSCVFRNRGTLLIYVFTGSIEKQKSQFWPSLKIISIPVNVTRDPETHELIGVGLGYINIQESCYPDTITGVLSNLGGRPDYNFLRNLVYAFGGHPDNYLTAPETVESNDYQPGKRNGDNRHDSKRGAYNNEKTAEEDTSVNQEVQDGIDISTEKTTVESDHEKDPVERCSIADQLAGKSNV